MEVGYAEMFQDLGYSWWMVLTFMYIVSSNYKLANVAINYVKNIHVECSGDVFYFIGQTGLWSAFGQNLVSVYSLRNWMGSRLHFTTSWPISDSLDIWIGAPQKRHPQLTRSASKKQSKAHHMLHHKALLTQSLAPQVNLMVQTKHQRFKHWIPGVLGQLTPDFYSSSAGKV